MRNYYLIGVAAKLANVCPDSIRTYHKLDLIHPIRDSSGRRLFSDEDIKRIRAIYQDNISRRPMRKESVPA